MNSNFRFSVLMANYNNGRYIVEAVNSVLQQTYSNWELIIIDDASTDDSVKLIKPFLKNQRIKFFKHEQNLGCGATKKDCAEKATGSILGILDPDDVLDKNAVNEMVKVYEINHNVGFVFSTHYECDEKLMIKNKNKWVGKIEEGKTNLQESKTSHFLTFKKEIYLKTTGFDFEQKSAVDKDIIYKLEEVSESGFVDLPLYYYRMHSKGISLGKQENNAYCWHIIARYKAYKRRLETNIPNFSKREMSNYLIKGGATAISMFDFKRALFFLKESEKLYSFNIHGYMLMIRKVLQKFKHRIFY